MVRNTAELLSFALLIGFLYLCWPPLALLGAAVLLFLWANFTKPTGGRIGAAVGAAVAAARRTYAASKAAP